MHKNSFLAGAPPAGTPLVKACDASQTPNSAGEGNTPPHSGSNPSVQIWPT